MESERSAPTYWGTMRITVTGSYSSVIGYVHENHKLDMVQDDYKLGNSLSRVAMHECCTDTRSDITKLKSTKTIK